MNRKNRDLSDLVNALSSTEKRHFTLFSKAFTGKEEDSLYMQLFRQTENDGNELLKDIKDSSPEVIVKTKQRLYGNILKSLRIYYQEKSADIIIQNLLSEVEILYRLSLPEQGQLLVLKANKLATGSEKFGLLLQALEWEKRLNIVTDTPTRSTDEIINEELATHHKLTQIMALENVYAKTMALKRQYGYARGETKALLERETVKSGAMPTLKECLSNKAKFYHNFIHSIYYWMVFDHRKAYFYSRSLIHPEKNTILPNDYIQALLQHITSSVCLGYFEDALSGIRLSEAYIEQHLLNQSRTFNGLMFAYHATYEIIVYNYMGKRNRLRETIKRTEMQLLQYDQVLSFELKQILMGNLMNAYMGLGNLKKADAIWSSMFNRQSKAIRRDIYADLYLFRLFSLLAGKTYVLLSSAALSACRFYKQSEDSRKEFAVELPIATLLSKELDLDKPEVLKEVIFEIRYIVKQFIAGLEGINHFQEHYSRYVIWADAILRDEPYYMAAAKWYATFQKDETNPISKS
jgi:hypothetical protein